MLQDLFVNVLFKINLEIIQNDFDIEIDRALSSTFKHNIEYDNIYIANLVKYGYAETLFNNQQFKHFMTTQEWKGFNGLNDCSIGIELANAGDDSRLASKYTKLPLIKASHKNGSTVKDWEAYTAAQYRACEEVSKVLVARYNLDDVVGHEDIAPNRKNDPGPAFPMQMLREACGFQGLPTK